MPYAFTSIPFTVAFTLGIALRMFPKYRYKITMKGGCWRTCVGSN